MSASGADVVESESGHYFRIDAPDTPVKRRLCSSLAAQQRCQDGIHCAQRTCGTNGQSHGAYYNRVHRTLRLALPPTIHGRCQSRLSVLSAALWPIIECNAARTGAQRVDARRFQTKSDWVVCLRSSCMPHWPGSKIPAIAAMHTASTTVLPTGGFPCNKYNAALASTWAEHQSCINRIKEAISHVVDCLGITEHLTKQGCDTVEQLWDWSSPWGRARFRYLLRQLSKNSIDPFLNAVRQWMKYCETACHDAAN